jgi:hypothetical protein
MILLECPETGEQHLVRNAVGYAGWKLISRSAPRPDEDHCHWCSESEAWVVDAEAKQRSDRLAAMRDPEALLSIIDNLTNEIAALKAVITGEAP